MNLFTCVDELVKNAVKANYKFLLIYEKLHERVRESYPGFTDKQISDEISGILKIKESFDHIAVDILHEYNLSEQVRIILNQEAKLLNIKNKAYAETRKFTPEEKKQISEFKEINRIKALVKKMNIRIILKMETDGDFFYIEVTNTAPILTVDLNRIFEKREEYRRLKNDDREHEFFINNLDTSESGFGLGYATIDSVLYKLGLDPVRSLTIISAIDTTVLLSLPIDKLKSDPDGITV